MKETVALCHFRHAATVLFSPGAGTRFIQTFRSDCRTEGTVCRCLLPFAGKNIQIKNAALEYVDKIEKNRTEYSIFITS